MFTGIIETQGQFQNKKLKGKKTQLVFKTPSSFLKGTKVGDSIAIDGTCLTVIEKKSTSFTAEVIPETLRDTTLGVLVPKQSRVNLEKALRAGDPLGGHFVTGHIDGKGKITSIKNRGENYFVTINLPKAFIKQCAPKGSVAVDGISLTIQKLQTSSIGIGIIPHTWKVTSLGQKQAGDWVNVEIDMLSKYVARAIQAR